MLFNVFVDTREGFTDYKNVIFTWSKNLHISKGPMIVVKKSKFLFEAAIL